MTKHFNAAFAMSFTHEEVVLERRDPEGWRRLGSVRFTRGDLGQQLGTLRAGDEPVEADQGAGPDTLLVIPDDQILYTTLTVPPGPEPALAVARALEGLTPYEVADLAFDWAPASEDQADSLRIAAVARRTLDEAEQFALSQGFRPTGFIARPGDDRFPGQPDFGPSTTVRDLTRRSSVSEPELRRAGVTSGSIAEIAEPAVVAAVAEAAPLPVISRITAHAYPLAKPEPAAVVKPERPVMSEFAIAPTRGAAASAAPRDLRAGPPVATEAPLAEAPVIRHPAPPVQPTTPGKALTPRAQAFHSRAAEARARRAADETTPTPAGPMASLIHATRAMTARPPSTFTVLLGLLVLALVVVLIFFGGRGDAPQPEQIAAAPVAGEAETLAEPTPVTPAPVETAVIDPAPAAEPVVEDTTEPVEQADLPVASAPAAEEPVDAPPAVPAPVAEVDPVAVPPAETAAAPADTPAATAAPANDSVAAEAAAPAADEAQAAREAAVQAALTEAQAEPRPETEAAAQPEASATTPVAEAPVAEAPVADPAPAPVAAAPAPAATQPAPLRTLALTRSTRPAAPPRRAAEPEATDASPVLPANPRPFAERDQAPPPRVTAIRPPSRPASNQQAAAEPAPAPAAVPAPTPAPAAQRPADSLDRSTRPPSRPDRQSMNLLSPRADDPRQAALTPAEIRHLQDLLKNLRTAELGNDRLSAAERGAVILLAEARPQRRPVDVRGGTQRAVDNAVAAAMGESPPPSKKPESEPQRTAASPAATGGLSRSARPTNRPSALAGRSGSSSVSGESVEKAIAAAVASGPLAPGGTALTALSSSPLPPRRSGNRGVVALVAPAAAAATATAGAAAQQVAAATPLPSASEAAAIEQQRREDAQLQAQAEARARDRAAADARAEAQARAAAEARARAQAEAEARAAAQRNQAYTPPEAEKEPEVATNVPRGSTAAGVAANATVKDGITINRTQIIGTIGAGKGSRALVRLSNGRVITLRLGDRINGGTITAIGNSRVTYVKGGRSSDLAVLDGR